MGSELYLRELGDGRFSILLSDDSTETQMPPMTPAEALIAFSELDYTDYRKVVRWLRDEHPLFEERIDIPVSDLEDFVAEAILLTPDLHEIDPVSGNWYYNVQSKSQPFGLKCYTNVVTGVANKI